MQMNDNEAKIIINLPSCNQKTYVFYFPFYLQITKYNLHPQLLAGFDITTI